MPCPGITKRGKKGPYMPVILPACKKGKPVHLPAKRRRLGADTRSLGKKQACLPAVFPFMQGPQPLDLGVCSTRNRLGNGNRR